MLSVLIIDTEVYEHYSKYDYFFGHFENNNDIAVCVWNRKSREGDIASMLPQLMDAVRNVPEWNAYIICEPHNSIAFLENDFKNKTQFSINPYERANTDSYDPDKDRLLKLVYLLGGRGDDRTEYIRQYQFRAARPNMIYLITPRILKNIEQQKHFLLSEIRGDNTGNSEDPDSILAGQVDLTDNYSEFWERYEYPPNCRFLVYDFPEEKHLTYQNSWFPFWVAVISMAQNSISNSILTPYVLYVLAIDIDDIKFAEYISEFYTMLLENKDINNRVIDKERYIEKVESKSTDITVSDDLSPVFVTFPNFDVGELYANDYNISIYKDRPVLDEDDWRDQMVVCRESIGKFFKAINRGKGEAVDYVHDSFKDAVSELRGVKLTKYDKEELTEAINQDELAMIELNLASSSSRAKFEKEQRKVEKMVRTYMKRRLRMKAAVGVILASMLVYFIGFIPYIINSLTTNFFSFLISLPISIGALIVPAIFGFVMLNKLKKTMSIMIGDYNGVIDTCYEDAKSASDLQSTYLTRLLDYMKKYEMLAYASDNGEHAQKIRELLVANAIFDDAIDECVALAELRNVTLTRITDRYVDNIIESNPNSRIYLYENNYGGKMALNFAKDALYAPFSFTDQIILNREDLYECFAYSDISTASGGDGEAAGADDSNNYVNSDSKEGEE